MKCAYCDQKAEVFCDYIYGTPEEFVKNGIIQKIVPFVTCDLPMCKDHRVYKGNIHYSGSRDVSGFETIDWCMCHTDDEKLHRPMNDDLAKKFRKAQIFQAQGGIRLVHSGAVQTDLFTGGAA
ncbi:hypothetical protein [Methylovorus mays]|uniref:hypothetical protein n=1 Tax=Methylovorus mays TaxID=184077 RepID=UPI001E5A40E5|nr:hypothetical protein [Methylovorus mays]MCB5206096.1 hypothetical protein [Methylovorus mays]